MPPTCFSPGGCLPAISLMVLLAGNAAAKSPAESYLSQPDEWFRSNEGMRVTTNILSWQSPEGSWPKNLDTTAEPYRGDPKKVEGTFDNNATTGELRFLARSFGVTKNPRCEQSFLRGLEHIVRAQYPSGGWPQRYPPGSQYHRHITFNDGTMVRLLIFLREVTVTPNYGFVPSGTRQAVQAAFDRGIACILKCQIRVNGKLTVWCAQHDELDYRPRGGRSYELPSLSGAESAGILRLLMSLESPSPAVVQAITAGAEWFESAKLAGIRIERISEERTLVSDPAAPPLWARFYDLDNGKPIFSDRDGAKKYNFLEIGPERRNGYAWFGTWGSDVAQDYTRWKLKQLKVKKLP